MVGIEPNIYTLGEEEATDALYRKLLLDASEQGHMEYRTHVRYMDDVAAKLDFNSLRGLRGC